MSLFNLLNTTPNDILWSNLSTNSLTMNNIQILPNAHSNYVLTSNSLGNGTWQPSSGPAGTTGPIGPTGPASLTLGPIGSSPNADAALLTGSVLTLQPANSSFGGLLSIGSQSVVGTKTFNNAISITPTTAPQIILNSAPNTVTLQFDQGSIPLIYEFYPTPSSCLSNVGLQHTIIINSLGNFLTAYQSGSLVLITNQSGLRYIITMPAVTSGIRFQIFVNQAFNTSNSIVLAFPTNTLNLAVFSLNNQTTSYTSGVTNLFLAASQATSLGDRIDIFCDGTHFFASCSMLNSNSVTTS